MQSRNQFIIFCGLVLAVIGGGFNPAFAQNKLSPNFNSTAIKTIADKMTLTVMVKDTAHFRKMYGAKGMIGQIHGSTKCVFLSIDDANVLQDLKSDPNVLFIDTQRRPHTEGDYDRVNPAINKINQVRNAYPDLHGAGYNVSIKEESFNEGDIDLKGRSFKTSISPSTTSQHATIMAVLIGGAGNSSPQANGVVNEARLTASNFNNLMPDGNAVFTNNNILIQNHSYGVGIENYYGNEAYAYDQQVAANPHLVHIFSSGNIGTAKPSDGTYKNLVSANLTGTFKQSKNVLVVSAIDTSLQVNAFNSRGPAYDGRLKPELTAYGPGGTSEAAALTTGMTSLIQEKYQLMNNSLPDVSLVKAILIASADDIGSKGIDFVTGYGNVNIYKALSIVDQNKLIETTLSQQDQVSFPITIGPGVAQLKIAVCWIDPPAIVNSSSALVNDIDAWVDDGTNIFKPWVLSAFPHPDSLNALAKRKTDHLNNTEFITIDNPQAGTYQLVLKSGNLSGGTQKISVAYYLRTTSTFSWTYPVTSDIVKGDVKNLLVWETQPNQVGDLYVQFNSGDWHLIKEQINLQSPFKWSTPDTLAKARLKMIISGNEFISDEFVISPQLELRTAFNCADSLGLYWNKIGNATGYEILALGNQYLEPIKTTTDTLVVFSKPVPTYFAVKPKLNEVIGINSGTIDYNAQGSYCFLNFFNADRVSASEIEIQLSLSTFYNVDHINILKTVNEVESILATFSSAELNYTFSDFVSGGGTYAYQAQIIFNDGSTLLSDRIELIIEGPGKVVIWPNPVTQDDYLNIISDGDATFRIVTQLGEIIFEEYLTALKTELDIESLPAGLYFYQLLNGKTITDTGRIIKF